MPRPCRFAATPECWRARAYTRESASQRLRHAAIVEAACAGKIRCQVKRMRALVRDIALLQAEAPPPKHGVPPFWGGAGYAHATRHLQSPAHPPVPLTSPPPWTPRHTKGRHYGRTSSLFYATTGHGHQSVTAISTPPGCTTNNTPATNNTASAAARRCWLPRHCCLVIRAITVMGSAPRHVTPAENSRHQNHQPLTYHTLTRTVGLAAKAGQSRRHHYRHYCFHNYRTH